MLFLNISIYYFRDTICRSSRNFFLLISTILLIKVINDEKNYLWFLIVLFFFLSFFTKQVPASYTILIQGFLIIFYIFYEKKLIILNYIVLSIFIVIFIFASFLFYFNIDFQDFYIQYIDYPRSIGESRFENLDVSLNSFFNKYKFILIPLIFTLLLKFRRIRGENEKFLKKEFYTFSLLICFVLSAIFHQLMTKNQIYIYFLVPILFGSLLGELRLINKRFRVLVSTLIIFSIFL